MKKHITVLISAAAFSVCEVRAALNAVASFPFTYTSAGRIELNVRLIGYQATAGINGTSDTMLFSTPIGYAVHFNGNDGTSGGGLIGAVTGDSWSSITATTGSDFDHFTYGNILGSQQQVDSWHTYALVWDSAGLAIGHRVAVYVDGVLDSGRFRDDWTGLWPSGSDVLTLGGASSHDGGLSLQRNIAFDNLRIWDGPDAATASLVLANDFEDRNLHSSVGPDGTYIAGSFVPSEAGNGQALCTVPEPPASLAVLLILGVFGIERWMRRGSRPSNVAVSEA